MTFDMRIQQTQFTGLALYRQVWLKTIQQYFTLLLLSTYILVFILLNNEYCYNSVLSTEQ